MNSASQDLPKHLAELRTRLTHPTDYEHAFSYFLEEFGGDKDFIAMGLVDKAPGLTAVMEKIATQALGKPVKIQQAHISRVPKAAFLHGSASLGDRAAIVFYFEEINTGLMAIMPGVRGQAEMARFKVPDFHPASPSQN